MHRILQLLVAAESTVGDSLQFTVMTFKVLELLSSRLSGLPHPQCVSFFLEPFMDLAASPESQVLNFFGFKHTLTVSTAWWFRKVSGDCFLGVVCCVGLFFAVHAALAARSVSILPYPCGELGIAMSLDTPLAGCGARRT